MAVVAVKLPSLMHLRRLQAATRDRHKLVVCSDWDAVGRACEAEPVNLLVVDLFATERPELGCVRVLKARHPDLAVVMYVAPTAERWRDLFDAGRAGIDALVLAGVDDSPLVLLGLIDQAERRGVAGLIARALADADIGGEERLNPTVRDALLVAVTRAQERLSPQSLAKILGITRRQLSRELADAGFPATQRLISWARLMVAAHLLQGPRRRADSVARTLGFPSGSAFRNQCQYYLHATPHQMRARGGAAYVLRVMVREVVERRRIATQSYFPHRAATRPLHLAV
jgi:AraC-like DNA-binding protein